MPLYNFALYSVVLNNAPLSDRDKRKKKKKNVTAMGYFSREILIHRHRCQEVPLSHWFAISGGGDNLLEWRELFANLYGLKSRILFW